MQIVHIDLTNGDETKRLKDMDEHEVQFTLNRYASYMASMGELLHMCEKDGITEVPVPVLVQILLTIMDSDEAKGHLEKVTEAGLKRELDIFHQVNGKEQLPDNVVSFSDKKKLH